MAAFSGPLKPSAILRLDTTATSKPSFLFSITAILSGQLACAIIAILTEISYARFLGPYSRGLISLCLMSIAFATLLGGLGGEGTIVYWSSRARNAFTSWLPAVLCWGILGCTLACVSWVVFSRLHLPFLRGISPSLAWLVLLNIPPTILFAYVMALLSGAEEFRFRAVCALSRQVIVIVSLLILLVCMGRRPEIALWANLAGLLVASLAALLLLKHSIKGFWRIDAAYSNLKPTLYYGLRGQVGNLATFFTYRFDVFIVNCFLQPDQLGFYALGVVVSEAIWQVPQAVASALFPRTARTDLENATDFTCYVLRQLFFITSVCGAVVAITCPLVIPLVFGASFRPSIAVIWWILPGTIALSLGKVACADLAGRGKNGYSSVFALVSFALTVGLDWLLIPRMGILGAAIASSIAYTANSTLILVALRFELKVAWKTLLVPSLHEVKAYRQVWRNLTNALDYTARNKNLSDSKFLSSEGE